MIARDYENLKFILEQVCGKYPKYEKFLSKRFSSSLDLKTEEEIAKKILKITDRHINEHIDAYDWMCDWFLKEEIEFRRTGRYKYTKFDQAYKNVYSRAEVMEPYMKGLLLSQVLWSNHASVYSVFVDELSKISNKISKVVEVGTGHGLFLATTVELLGSRVRAEGWDVSQASLKETQFCLDKLLKDNVVDLKQVDILQKIEDSGNIDFLIFSEVLEHLEYPEKALFNLRNILSEKGVMFLNVPINSPSPDHISNWSSPEDFTSFVKNCGYKVLEKKLFPASGLTLERALKFKAALNIVLVLEKE